MWLWLATSAAWVAAGYASGLAGTAATLVLALLLPLPALVITLRPLRRAWRSAPLLGQFRRIMPEMSDTEKDAIEHRLKQAVRDGKIDPMPQNVPALEQWVGQAAAIALISADEKARFDRYAEYSAMVVRVDDFPPDFNVAADLAKQRDARQQAASRVA